MIKNANARTTPVLKNPNMFVLATSANIGGSTSKTLRTVSMASFTEGKVEKLDPKYAKSFNIDISTATYKPFAILKSNRVFNDQSNYGEFDILRMAVSNESTNKTMSIALFLDATVTGPVNFQYADETCSIVSYAEVNPSSQTINDIANLTPFYEIIVGPGGTQSEHVEMLKLIFQIGRDVVVAVRTTGTVAGTFSINWFEQQ